MGNVELLRYLALFTCAFVSACNARRSLADATVFNVKDYGAKADQQTDDFPAFAKAWNEACKTGGAATVLIPSGSYVTGQVEFQGPCKGPMTVEVQGTIVSVSDISSFPSAEWFTFEEVNDLVVTGSGTFDGRGSDVWKYNNCESNANCQLLPTSLKFTKIIGGAVRGITSVNSKSFHFMIHSTKNFVAENITIKAPEESPNTDGIHISSSSSITIANTLIGTGDDCISVGQGSLNVTISGVTCGPGHGISVGSLGKYPNEENVADIAVRNCTLVRTTNGVRIKTWPGSSPSDASRIVFEDIQMQGVKNPIIVDQNYWSKSKLAKPSLVKLNNLQFTNIRGSSTSEVAVSIKCSSAVPCEEVKLQDIDLSYNGEIAKSSLCENAKTTFQGTMNPPPCKSDDLPIIA